MTRKTAARITISVMIIASSTYCILLKNGIAPPPKDTLFGIGLLLAAVAITAVTLASIAIMALLSIMGFLGEAFEDR